MTSAFFLPGGEINVLDKLQGPSWRGVPFPLTHLQTSGSTDLVEHKHPDQNGWHVEATGANNLVIAGKIPFRNGISPAQSELWGGRALYPEVFRAFVTACADTSTGVLIHPELGQLNVKCRHYSWEYDPNKRDGADFNVEWIQTLDDGEFVGSIANPSPVSAALAIADNLDDQLVVIPLEGPPLASFSDMFRSLQAIPDTATLVSMQVGGVFDKIGGQIERVEDSLRRLNNVRYWPIVDGIQHLRAALNDLQHVFDVKQTKVREYVVLTPTTLSALAQFLNQKIDDSIRLNPLLVEEPVIRAQTRVKYFLVK